jgi:probable rRNA maturation factor
VFAADEQTDVAIDIARWERLAHDVLVDEGVGDDVEVSLLFVDEATIAGLNAQFMGKTGPTDVLSFPIDEHDTGREPAPSGPTGVTRVDDDELDDEAPTLLGDVVVCPTVAQRNAPLHRGDDHDGSLDDELALLVVHGLLHLLGLDHKIKA